MSVQIIDLILDEESLPLGKNEVAGQADEFKNFLLSANIKNFSFYDPDLQLFETLKVFNSDALEYLTDLFSTIWNKTTDKTENLLLGLESQILIVLEPQSSRLGLFVIDDGKTDPMSSIGQVVNTLLHWLWLRLNSY